MRNEQTNIGLMLLRSMRIVMPKVLRKRVLDLAHEGHLGIAVMKRQLSSKAWWPDIDKDVKRSCQCSCGRQLVSKPIDPKPIIRTALPSGPWQEVTIDLSGPLTSGDYIFVVIDYFCHYLELDVIKTVTTESYKEPCKDVCYAWFTNLNNIRYWAPIVNAAFKRYVEANGI